MANLRKFTLSHDKKSGDWKLKADTSHQTVHTFRTKTRALEGGVLKSTLGPAGGSVKIKKANGVIQEERTYPRSRDPRRSKG